jgi:quinol monooxygenase YgiN
MQKTTLDFIFTFQVKEGKESEFDALTSRQLAVTTEKDPGVLIYNIFKNGDGTYCQFERYKDSAALAAHLANTADLLAQWYGMTEITQMIVLGDIDDAVRKSLESIPHQHFGVFKFLDR